MLQNKNQQNVTELINLQGSYGPISQQQKLVYNDRISNFKLLLFIKGRMAVTWILQGLSCKVYSTTSPIFAFA